MAEDNDNSAIRSEIVQSLSSTVRDIYADTLQPAAKEVGKVGETLGKAINLALAPVRIVVVGLDAKARQLEEGLKLRLVGQEDKLVEPQPQVAVPALAAFAYCADVPGLREMYLNLLATSMHQDTAPRAHPAFVDIIRQLSPDEARIIHLFRDSASIPVWQIEVNRHKVEKNVGYFDVEQVFKRMSLISKDAKCEYPENIPASIDNLLRLGIIYETRKWPLSVWGAKQLSPVALESATEADHYLGGRRLPELVQQHPELLEIAKSFVDSSDYLQIWKSDLRLTPFGISFCLTCVTDAVKTVQEESGQRSRTVLAEEAL